jgi:hypothetical protein
LGLTAAAVAAAVAALPPPQLLSAGVIYNDNELNSAMAATAAAKPVALWPEYTPAYWQTVVDRVS